MADEENKKTHKNRHAGRKAEKKKAKNPHVQVLTDKQRNPKAFAFQSINKSRDKFIRSQDILSKKHHLPVVDRTPVEPPPVLVAIVGGPKSGKSTLLKCLINNYCDKKKLTQIVGPVTVVAGKKKKITFVEVNNDINSIIDIAKVADVVLLLIDATFGIEMEVFEFLEICKAHGSPRIMGILNHLDLLKNNKALKKKKKDLKHRFQVELYPGAKLFYLTGLLNGAYLRNEIKNLCRFISVMKFRPLQFRSSHPYILVDRIEDVTNPEEIRQNKKCDRKTVLYGYVRGIPFHNKQAVHIAGVGDYRIGSITVLPDPCPLPEVLKKRSLNTEERLLYAPMSGVSGIVYDKDAVYIDSKDLSLFKDEDQNDDKTLHPSRTGNILDNLMKVETTTDEKQEISEFRLFSNSAPVDALNFNDSESDEDESGPNRGGINFESVTDESGQVRRKVIFDKEPQYQTDSDSDDGYEDFEGPPQGDENESDSEDIRKHMFIEASKTFKNSFVYHMREMAYGDLIENASKDIEDALDGDLFRIKTKSKFSKNELSVLASTECSRCAPTEIDRLTKDEVMASIKDCFTTGTWDATEDTKTLLEMDDEEEEACDDFEDLETGEVFKGESKKPEETSNKRKREEKEEKTAEERRLEKKRRIKEMFDADDTGKQGNEAFENLKTEMSQQAQLNQDIFQDLDEDTRAQYEGFRAGKYLRIEFDALPCEFIENFDPSYPIIVGGLTITEQSFGFLRVRLKLHRWYPKILKNGDPLILSLGWRRFQTTMFYAKREDDFRLRSLKYAKKYLHVEAVFWGPVLPSTSSYGFVGFQKVTGERVSHFRIAANGVLLENDENKCKITKKLKLIGYPEKIFVKTVFIKDMFHNELEVQRFIGARLQTQSGLRGIIKKASGCDGKFRATFEDTIKMSDVVFLKTWAEVEVAKFCVSLKNLLLPSEQKAHWQGMRTVGEIKKALNLKVEPNPDNLYTEVTERCVHVPKSLHIPKSLQANLPYNNRPKMLQKQNKIKRIVVVKEPGEVQEDKFMSKLSIIIKDKKRRESRKKREQARKYRESAVAQEGERQTREKKRKAEICRLKSLQGKKKNKNVV